MSDIIRYIPFSESSEDRLPRIICLGNFDGVHVGHATLIKEAVDIKAKLSRTGQKVAIGALCFDSLSSDHFSKTAIPHLMTLEKKLETFREMSLDCAYVCDFSKIKDLSPQEFIDKILRDKCSCIGVVCGFNFKFGKNASGDAELLVSSFSKFSDTSLTCKIVPPIMIGTRVVSSSAVREMLSHGLIEDANTMLGRNFSITHTVVHGKHLGTQLGFPTLNHILSKSEIIPSFGIYATKTLINGKCYRSVTNIGVRPTVSTSSTVTCETHIIDIENSDNDLYGHKAEIIFYSKLRDEKRFGSPRELSIAIAADVEAAKKYFTKYE